MENDLASDFQDIDRATNFAVFSRCLTLVDSIPFFADGKRERLALLGVSPGQRILDVGCGLGTDAAALAKLVAPNGAVVGIDGSRAMIEAARERHGDVGNVSFVTADAASLPFDDASFDACRIDRVMQHIADPASAIREMTRVLRPGGVLAAYDNDWETLTVDVADRALTRTILNAWCDRFPSGWIGRQLVPLLLDAGFADIQAIPKTLVLRELETAERLYSFTATAGQLAEAGAIDHEQGIRWLNALRTADAKGRFFSSLTAFLVRAKRSRIA